MRSGEGQEWNRGISSKREELIDFSLLFPSSLTIINLNVSVALVNNKFHEAMTSFVFRAEQTRLPASLGPPRINIAFSLWKPSRSNSSTNLAVSYDSNY